MRRVQIVQPHVVRPSVAEGVARITITHNAWYGMLALEKKAFPDEFCTRKPFCPVAHAGFLELLGSYDLGFVEHACFSYKRLVPEEYSLYGPTPIGLAELTIFLLYFYAHSYRRATAGLLADTVATHVEFSPALHRYKKEIVAHLARYGFTPGERWTSKG